MGRLFGTDGARGIANTELSCELAMQIGRAAAVVLTRHTSHTARIVIGKDTRLSSDMLEAALVAGICSVGANVELLGYVPTPAVAYLVKKYGADAGVMISASHNPAEFNGIKLFSKDGFKLRDQIEEEIEALVLDDPQSIPLKVGGELGRVVRNPHAVRDYVKHIMSTIDGNLEGIRVAIDCANGSASATAEMLFKGLGANCYIINDKPDGVNINDGCGSTHPEALGEFVRKNRCQLGLAFDGDADRCLAVDENGTLVDGDRIMAILAAYMKARKSLKQDTVVVTVMSNLGFFRFADDNGICTSTTKVGDRYVLEEMLEKGFNLGGESSGHIIFLDHASTGDGQLTAVQLLSVYKQIGRKMSDLATVMERYPQVMVNVALSPSVNGRELLDSDEVIRSAIAQSEEAVGMDGRILVRASGTEPLIRVMIEGRDFDLINQHAVKIADVIKGRIAQ